VGVVTASNRPAFPLVIRKGAVWCWEPLNPAERCQIEVLSAEWTGQEWYVEIQALEDAGHMWTGMRNWYELNWFVEASVLVSEPRGAAHDTSSQAMATIEVAYRYE
jgi:hypothetical protein